MKILQAHQKLQHWFRFLAGGVINTGFTYGLYYLLQKLFFYQIAYAIAYASGIIFSYWFNAHIVFKTPLSWKGLFTYPLVYVVHTTNWPPSGTGVDDTINFFYEPMDIADSLDNS